MNKIFALITLSLSICLNASEPAAIEQSHLSGRIAKYCSAVTRLGMARLVKNKEWEDKIRSEIDIFYMVGEVLNEKVAFGFYGGENFKYICSGPSDSTPRSLCLKQVTFDSLANHSRVSVKRFLVDCPSMHDMNAKKEFLDRVIGVVFDNLYLNNAETYMEWKFRWKKLRSNFTQADYIYTLQACCLEETKRIAKLRPRVQCKLYDLAHIPLDRAPLPVDEADEERRLERLYKKVELYQKVQMIFEEPAQVRAINSKPELAGAFNGIKAFEIDPDNQDFEITERHLKKLEELNILNFPFLSSMEWQTGGKLRFRHGATLNRGNR